MSNCTKERIKFPALKRRLIEANFDGGEVSGNGGALLLREVDRRTGLLGEAARRIKDPRDPQRIQHSLESLLKQRVYGLALAHEDLNDRQSLRHDTLFQASLERDEALASSPTLCRMENWLHHRDSAVAIHQVMVDNFRFIRNRLLNGFRLGY